MGTVITFLLDRSGSMGQIKTATINAFNAYVDGLKEEAGDDETFTLVTFDSLGLDKVQLNVPVRKIVKLTKDSYVPRDSTPLIDSAWTTIRAVEKYIADKTDTKVIICIQTDGYENCSTQHTFAELNALIKEKIALGWQFNFMGAGIDAYDQGLKMGIAAGQTMSYDPSQAVTTNSAFTASARAARSFVSGRTQDTSYTASEKLGSGDKFDPSLKGKSPWANPATPPQAEKPKIVGDLDLNG